MRALIEKELRLVVHPSTYALVILGVLILIPSWMFGAIFIYGILIAFFNGMNAREMNDLDYTFALPVSRRSIARARVFVMAGIEVLLLLILGICMVLREPLGINALALDQGMVGMAANLYLLGFGFVVFGIFNVVFYPLYFRDPTKIGVPFVIACIPATVVIVVLESLPYLPLAGVQTFGVPGFADPLAQFAFLGACLVLFALSNLLATRLAQKAFSTYDL